FVQYFVRYREGRGLSNVGGAVVDENIGGSNGLDGLMHEPLQSVLLADVAGNRNDFASERSKLQGSRFKVFQLAAGDHDVGPRRCQRLSNGLADAATTAGDDCDFVAQTETWVVVHLFYQREAKALAGIDARRSSRRRYLP